MQVTHWFAKADLAITIVCPHLADLHEYLRLPSSIISMNALSCSAMWFESAKHFLFSAVMRPRVDEDHDCTLQLTMTAHYSCDTRGTPSKV